MIGLNGVRGKGHFWWLLTIPKAAKLRPTKPKILWPHLSTFVQLDTTNINPYTLTMGS